FLWFVILSVSVIGIVLSQSRSALIGTFFISLPMAALHLYRTHQFKSKTWGAIAVFLIFVFSLTNFTAVMRIRLPEASFLSLIRGETSFDSISGTDRSISERLFLYKSAWELWKKKPFLGYGPGTSSVHLRMIYDTDPDKIGLYTHFHNFFLDILVQLGMIGLLFYMIFFYKLVQQLIRSRRKGDVDLDVFLFVVGSLALIGISCLTDQPLNHPKGLYLLVFLSGTCYMNQFKKIGLQAD
ncbi:MAG: O-antigen ligase domain-containing protein, partial [Deltaproteobacteria bacterium]